MSSRWSELGGTWVASSKCPIPVEVLGKQVIQILKSSLHEVRPTHPVRGGAALHNRDTVHDVFSPLSFWARVSCDCLHVHLTISCAVYFGKDTGGQPKSSTRNHATPVFPRPPLGDTEGCPINMHQVSQWIPVATRCSQELRCVLGF